MHYSLWLKPPFDFFSRVGSLLLVGSLLPGCLLIHTHTAHSLKHDRSLYVIWYNCLRWLHDIIIAYQGPQQDNGSLGIQPMFSSSFYCLLRFLFLNKTCTCPLPPCNVWAMHLTDGLVIQSTLMGLDWIIAFQRFFLITAVSSLKCYHSNNVCKVLLWSTLVFQKAPTQKPEHICIFFFQKKRIWVPEMKVLMTAIYVCV